MLQILSGFYRNLPLSDVTFHENVTAAVCYYAAIRKRRVVPASNYRSHGVIIAIVIRSRGEAKEVRTWGDLPQWDPQRRFTSSILFVLLLSQKINEPTIA